MIDLDGTLLDTVADLAEAANRMRVELGMKPLLEDTIKTYVGKGMVKLVKRSLTGELDGEPDPAIYQQAMPLYERHYSEVLSRETCHYPGVLEGLQEFRKAGYRLACVTNKAERFTLPLLEQMGLAQFFEIVVSGDTLPKRKPDPLPLLHVCQRFGIMPQEMLLIGDSLNDTQAARAADCHVFVVPYGYNEGEDARELGADAVIESLADAVKFIKKA